MSTTSKSNLEYALELAELGLYVFRLRENSKLSFKGWQQEATRDSNKIHQLFSDPQLNIGILTNRFGNNEYLIVVDVDVKKRKQGDRTYRALLGEGKEFPQIFKVVTATIPEAKLLKIANDLEIDLKANKL